MSMTTQETATLSAAQGSAPSRPMETTAQQQPRQQPPAFPLQEGALAMLSIDHQLLDPADAARVVIEARKQEASPLAVALEQGLLAANDVLLTAAEQLGIPTADLDAPDMPFELDRELLAGFDSATLEELQILPVRQDGEPVVLASDTDSAAVADWVSVELPDAQVRLTPQEQLRELLLTELAVLATEQLSRDLESGQLAGVGESAPVRRWLDAVLEAAVAQRASDVHLQSDVDGSLMVRFRIDGVLVAQPSPPAGIRDNVVLAAMARAEMDTANTLEDQDQSFTFTSQGRKVNVRASMLPTQAGPKVVFRILDSASMKVGIGQLGFSDEMLAQLTSAMSRSNGTLLVVGPTGSGKTTTLYSLLSWMTTPERNVTSVEDPVEYRLPGVAQTQVRVRAEKDRQYTFAKALRTILRQDPDVILIGEVRDEETATVAMEASLTGHLVLSSVHAPDAVSTYSRLMRIGVPSYQVAQAISMVLAQRLLRRAHTCARWDVPTAGEQELLSAVGAGGLSRVRREVGCQRCYGTGFRGRVAVAELLVPGREFSAAVERGATADELSATVGSGVFLPFATDAVRHLEAGTTTVSEVRRVLEGLV